MKNTDLHTKAASVTAKQLLDEAGSKELLYEFRRHEEWYDRFEGYLNGTKTLPVLYDPFFKQIFNPDAHRDRLSELISAFLGEKVTVVETLNNDSSEFIGTLVIMDIVVKMSDGSYANIEVQKIPYNFPAERISCYSSDLVMRQYNTVKQMAHDDKAFSYRNLKKVHTIIFFESSKGSLISATDSMQYFHVGKTTFNTNIPLELLTDYHLICLDTFRKYRYPRIKDGDISITDYDYDSSLYKNSVPSDLLRKRLMYLSLFAISDMKDVDAITTVFPELIEIFEDMSEYLTKPKEALGMFSEALKILDENTIRYMIDEANERVEAAERTVRELNEQAKIANRQIEAAQQQAEAAHQQAEVAHQQAEAAHQQAEAAHQQAEAEKEARLSAEAELARLREELAKYK